MVGPQLDLLEQRVLEDGSLGRDDALRLLGEVRRLEAEVAELHDFIRQTRGEGPSVRRLK